MSRGLNNCNPGNIRKNAVTYQGEVHSTDPAFKQFRSMAYGYRAMFKILFAYIERRVDTVHTIIHTWAPPIENDSDQYVRNVCVWTGLQANEKIRKTDKDKLISIVAAMSRMENGVSADIGEIQAGWDLLT